jgi:hypothetical protein
MNTKNLFLIILAITTWCVAHNTQCAAAPTPYENPEPRASILTVRYREEAYKILINSSTTVADVKCMLALQKTFFPADSQQLIAKHHGSRMGTYLEDGALAMPLLEEREVRLVAK